MTRDELNRRRMMFQIYANRNKMPQIQKNDNEEPLKHSATNEYLEYRKKVAAGMKMQRDNRPSDLFDVTAANEQYYQDLMDQNIIIHAGMNNQYIAKLDDFYGKGKPRYFYDQTEWDNYRKNMQGAGRAAADRGARETFNNKSNLYKNNSTYSQNAGADRGAKQKEEASKIETKSYSDKKIENDLKNKGLAEAADNSYQKAYRNSLLNRAQSGREESIKNSKKNADREKFLETNKSGREASMNGSSTKASNDAKNKDLANKAQEAFNNSPAANTEFRTSTDVYKNKDLLESNQKSKENAIKRSDPEYQKELEKAKTIKADKERWGAYTTKEISSLVNDDKRFSNIKTEDDAVNYPGGVEKLYNDIEAALEEKYPEKKKNYEASKNAGADRAAKEKENVEKEKEDSELYNIKKDVVKDAKKPGATVKDLADKYKLPEAYVNYIVYDETGKNIPEDKKDLDTHREMNALRNKRSKEGAIERSKKSAKHSSLEDGITTSEELTPDQEYLDFRARVEEGMKHYSMARGLMSIPMNQALAHAGTGKYGDYYNKIDNYYGPGKARYFKTKDEWDAHQRELDSYKKKAEKDIAERDRKIAQQNEWNKNSQANPGAQRGAQEYINGRIANKQNQKETANKKYYETQSKANPEQRRGFTESAQGRLAGSNFNAPITPFSFNNTPNMNLYGVDNNAAAKTATARNTYQSSYRNDLLNKAQSGREAAIRNSAPGIDKDIQRRKFLEANQSGREAAMNNSSNNSASVQRLLNNLSAPIPENVKAAWEARAKALDEAGQTEVYRQQLDHLEKRVAADEFAWRAQDIIESALRSSKVDYDTKDEIRDSLKKIRKLVNDHGYFDDPEYDKALNKMINNNDYYMEPERRARENSNLSYKMDQIEKDYDDKKFKDMSRTLQSIMFNLEPEVRSQIFAQLADAGIDYDYLANGNSSTTLSNILEDLYGDKLRERTDI